MESEMKFKELTNSKESAAIIEYFNKGYRVVGNEIIKPSGKPLKSFVHHTGYPAIRFTHKDKRVFVRCHKFAAYQYFGLQSFVKDMQTRHLNNNKLDFSVDNIALGTRSENANDSKRYGYKCPRIDAHLISLAKYLFRKSGYSKIGISKCLKISESSVHDIVNEVRHKDINYFNA